MKKNIKTTILLLSISIGLFSLNACGSSNNNGEDTPKVEPDNSGVNPEIPPSDNGPIYSENIDLYNGIYLAEDVFQGKAIWKVVGISKDVRDVVIPDYYKNGEVQIIETGAFYDTEQVRSITLPNSIRLIRQYSFIECNGLNEITLPENLVQIENNAFLDCLNLEKLTILSKNVELEDNAIDAPNIIEATIPVNAIGKIDLPIVKKVNLIDGYSIPDNAFENCFNLKEITLPDTINQIGEYAFSNCPQLEKIEIPSNVTSIRNYAFANCNSLTEITLPKNINNLGNHVFDNCTLTKATIPAKVLNKMVLDNIETLIITNGDIYNNDCKFSSIGELIIEDEVTYINNYAFANTSVSKAKVPYKYLNSIPKDVEELTILATEEIEDNAFIEFKNLKKINLPDTITKIGDNAFNGLDKLESINLPKSLNIIGESAFDGCMSLEELIIPDSVTEIGKYAFKNCTSINNINIPANIESLEEGIFFNSISLDNIDIPSSVKSIGNNAFDGCINLSTIYIPDTINNVGEAKRVIANTSVNGL